MKEIADYDTAGALINRYVHGPWDDEPLVQVTSAGTLTFFHQDKQKSVIAITSNAGAVNSKFVYSPFGESSSLIGTTFGYTGQRYDSESGLYYYKARYYSPNIGRFLQPDQLDMSMGSTFTPMPKTIR